ncbi:hypothetical protein LSM04_001890 [Trypanosoma melophagium]|uniref:uncharacterized protein n=1 Tax=Trypanosoma melophagium TaxID=715481 RepID=UPI00351AB014|nr:hypothetical protein LSM04_001890 [Trypanosoma melophagium]
MQRCTVVGAMANIVNDLENMHNVTRREVVILLQCGVREMTAIVDLTSLWSQEALRLVVGLCRLFPDEGTISHFAEKYPESVLPFIKDLWTNLLPPLGAAKQDNHRMLLARACGSLAKALLKTSGDTPNTLKVYNELMYSTLNFFIGDYSRCNEPRV